MVRDYFRAHRLQLMIALLAVAALVVLLWTAIAAMRPMPPRTVTMATGPEGGAYYEVGQRYRELLAHQGIDLQLLPTAGSVENLARMRDPRSNVQIGFLQSGMTSRKESPGLESLGTVFYEPLWFFYRTEYRVKGIQGLRGKKISIGPEGSGTRALALELLARNGIDQNFAQLLSLTPQQAGDKLLRNEIDAALMLTSWDAPVVQQLIVDKNVELANFPRTDAYIALYPFLNKLTVPAGVADLAKNRPPRDVLLFAPKASLVVRQDLHPAVQYLLLDAAEKIHSGPGIFQKAGQFPAAESIDLPLSDEARQFYKSGRPFLQRHLPFWLAVLVDRLLVLLIPVVGVLYPLVRFAPAVYGLQMQRRIYRLYGELRFLEKDLESPGAEQSIGDLRARLDRIQEKANHLRVPVFYSNMLYTLRMHITLVRERMERSREKGE
jgi:TRAP transporter TAXI family solute receptor